MLARALVILPRAGAAERLLACLASDLFLLFVLSAGQIAIAVNRASRVGLSPTRRLVISRLLRSLGCCILGRLCELSLDTLEVKGLGSDRIRCRRVEEARISLLEERDESLRASDGEKIT